jgi:hypothetical protein
MSLADTIFLPGTRLANRAAAIKALPYAAIVVAGIITFFPGLRAGFVSDDFDNLSWIGSATFGDVLSRFVPTSAGTQLTTFYRPLSDLLLWVEYHVFGAQPVADHVVALVCHLAIAALLFRVAQALGIRLEAALAGAAAFLLTIHAHEVVFWWAAGHFAFGGLAIVAAVLAYVEGWTWLSLACTVLALLTDEAGVALLPTLVACEALFGRPLPTPPAGPAAALGRRLLRLAPTAAAVVAFLAVRLNGGAFWSNPDACHDPECDALGVVQYFDQLFLRPGRLIELLRAYGTPNRLVVGAVTLGLFVVVAALLRAWRWRDWRVIAFGAAWCVMFAAVFIYGLWPDMSDRFLYYPEMGLALALAGVIQQALRTLESGPRPAQVATGAVLAGYLIWLALGIPTVWHRAGQWVAAGQTVSGIFDSAVRVQPRPAPGTVLVFEDVPDTLLPDIPPGNTGPYLLRNGLSTGMRLRYGRTDVQVIAATSPVPAGAATVVCLDIEDTEVVRAACPR